jgi:hypothetical protein
MERWVGHDISEIVKIWGEPDSIKEMRDSFKEYKYIVKDNDPSCIQYWLVNEKGMIASFHYDGRCRPV